MTIQEQIVAKLQDLPTDKQRTVLRLVESLAESISTKEMAERAT